MAKLDKDSFESDPFDISGGGEATAPVDPTPEPDADPTPEPDADPTPEPDAEETVRLRVATTGVNSFVSYSDDGQRHFEVTSDSSGTEVPASQVDHITSAALREGILLEATSAAPDARSYVTYDAGKGELATDDSEEK